MADLMTDTASASLDALVRPRSIAIIGASDDPRRIGGRPLHNTHAAGFSGRIYPVNPKRDTVQGLPAFPTIGEVPEPVDCAVVAVPAGLVAETVSACAASGVRSTIILSSGFAEQGTEGAAAQEKVREIAADAGMRLLGPNCMGAMSLRAGWFGTFSAVHTMLETRAGGTAIVSQSGAFGSHLLFAAQKRGVATDLWVTTGNEADIDAAEVIGYYARHPEVRTILAYTEGIKDRDRICAALDLARAAHKPVIMIKVGDTDVGAEAAATHTASLAGADEIYDALFRQYGVYRARSCEEMVDIAYACQTGRFPKGGKIAIQSVSGGIGIQMADASVKMGLEVPVLPQNAQQKLLELMPYAGVRNPVDITGQILNDPEAIEKSIDLLIRESGCDAIASYIASAPQAPGLKEICLAAFETLRAAHPDVPLALGLIGPQEVTRTYEDMGIACFEDPVLAVRAVAALAAFQETFTRGAPGAPPALPPGALPVPDSPVSEHRAKAILASAGLTVTRDILATTPDEAVAAWSQIGGRVVLKIASPGILHKSDIGAVLLGLDDAGSIRDGFETVMARSRAAFPDAVIEGVIVSEMVTGGVETVLGVTRDPVFGPAVMFGLGGVFVEVLKDVTFRLAPFGPDEAHRMIDDIKGRKMLDGARGAPPADLDALADALARLSVFAAENAETISSIDVNPLLVREKGAIALDAVIAPWRPGAGPGSGPGA